MSESCGAVSMDARDRLMNPNARELLGLGKHDGWGYGAFGLLLAAFLVDHSNRRRSLYRAVVATMLVACLCLAWRACRNTKAPAGSLAADGACVADSVGSLRLVTTVPGCSREDLLCHARCILGDGVSCLGMAYAAESDWKRAPEAVRLYHRACLSGLALACTNYAASIWARESSEEELVCARRTFEKACAAREPFGCGMVGRMMLESTSSPSYGEGRRYLERTCDEMGGFPCRVLAKHLESGELGAYQPEVIRTLLARACAGGDPNGCGEPDTAAGTFR